MQVFESDLILTENTVFNESITVKGNIISENGLWDINAWDIKAMDIICEKRILKDKNSKTVCRIFITNKSKLERKEQILKKEEMI